MASIVTRADGSREIHVLVGKQNEQERRTIYLGKASKKDADTFCTRVEKLAMAFHLGSTIDPETLKWANEIESKHYNRLAKFELLPPREDTQAMPTLGEFVKRFQSMKQPSLAESSYVRMNASLGDITSCFAESITLDSLTAGHAAEYESWGRKKGFSEAHQRTNNRYAKQLFSFAIDLGLLPENPFKKLKSTSLPATVRHYVTPEDTLKLLKACPTDEWRVLIGLARYAGLRNPSETFAITWRDVDWDRNALNIPSKKTRRYAEYRPCPIIPELLPILENAFNELKDGATQIVTLSLGNVRRKLPEIIEAAGLTKWEDLFQTLRRSCETHLVSLGHKQHAVSVWLGHSEQVSKDHYLMVTSEAFQEATQIRADTEDRPAKPTLEDRAKSRAARRRTTENDAETADMADVGTTQKEGTETQKTLVKQGFSTMAGRGLEPRTHGFSVRGQNQESPGKTREFDNLGNQTAQNPAQYHNAERRTTPPEIVDWLNRSLENCPADTDTRERIREAVLSIIVPTPIGSATAQPERTNATPTHAEPGTRQPSRKPSNARQ